MLCWVNLMKKYFSIFFFSSSRALSPLALSRSLATCVDRRGGAGDTETKCDTVFVALLGLCLRRLLFQSWREAPPFPQLSAWLRHRSIDFTTSWSGNSLMFLFFHFSAVEKVDVADGRIRIEDERSLSCRSVWVVLRRWSGFDSG